MGHINSSLTSDTQNHEVVKLVKNAKTAFIGYYTRGMGFVLPPEEALQLLGRTDADYTRVIHPFINGEDIVRTGDQRPTRWVIDFADLPLEEAAKWPAALSVITERVRPGREHDPEQMKRWWQFWNTRIGLRTATASLDRFAASPRVGKRLLLTWCEAGWKPSDACVVFAVSDDYRFGVLSSRIHSVWVWKNSSTLKGDLRYTPTTAFETFPFPPSPIVQEQERVAEATRLIVALRRTHCDALQIGLTKLYNLMDDGGVTDLKAAHIELDWAVAAAYGWDESIITDDALILDRLYDLNAEITAGNVAYAPFAKEKSP